MKPVSVIIATASIAALSLIAGPALADPATDTQTPGTLDQTVERLVELNPGVTAEEMRKEITNYAKQEGLTESEVASEALRAAEDAEQDYIESSTREGTDKPAGARAAATSKLPKVRVGGDIFYNPAQTSFIRHGHVGIYSSQTRIVEAPGVGQLSRSKSAKDINADHGTKLMYVTISESLRKAAGKYAYDHYRGKPYNLNFAFNKSTNSKRMNCSQLVWAAFKARTHTDIDGNGGPGVYPKDILNSKKTKTWKTY